MLFFVVQLQSVGIDILEQTERELTTDEVKELYASRSDEVTYFHLTSRHYGACINVININLISLHLFTYLITARIKALTSIQKILID